MVNDVIATGATIEEAQQAAVAALNAPADADVQFEVISFPEKKVFGLFGGKEAKVKAFYEVKEEKPQKTAKPKQAAKPAQKAAPKKDAAKKAAAPKKESASPKAETKKEEPEIVKEPVALEDCPDTVKKAYDYLTTVIKGVGIDDAEISISRHERDYFFYVSSEEDYGNLIGRRGDTLDAIQYLTRLAANHGREEGKSVRISINIGDYRQKRERTLKEIARKNAKRVRKYGRKVTLNPMNPAERRIIHTTVTEVEGVVSYSVGSDGDRRVVIDLAEGVEPLSKDRPRRNDRGGRGNGRGGRSGYGHER